VVVALETGCVVGCSMGVTRTLEMGCGEVGAADIAWQNTSLKIGLTGGLVVMALEAGCGPVPVSVVVYVMRRFVSESGVETEGCANDCHSAGVVRG
jgi:hypothetical protein